MRVHVFIDAENISNMLFKKSYSYLNKRYDVAHIDMFGKTSKMCDGYDKVRFVQCFYGKNSADTFMATYIVKSLYEEPLVDGFVLVTQDRDFAPVVKAVTDRKKQAIIVSEKNMTINNIQEVGADMNLVSSIELDVKRTKTVLLRNGIGELIEIPFHNGIKYMTFIKSVPIQKIREGYGKSRKLKSILKDSFLSVKKERVYIEL